MQLALYHGRLSPTQGGTNLEGVEVDDWGFEGPTLAGVQLLDFTYGSYTVKFVSEQAYRNALYKTGWKDGVHELSLEINHGEDCVCIWNAERNRYEYFGDYILRENT